MAHLHDRIERSTMTLGLLILVAISVGGFVQIVPLYFQAQTTQAVPGLEPRNALELAGNDIYVREGCYTCHSQMIRPFRAETERYGHYSVAGEFIYDRPFQWGSKRTGPDLHRVGGRYSDEWHRLHLMNPRDVVPESVMPGYPWLAEASLDGEDIRDRMRVLRGLGHPYSDEDIEGANDMVAGKTEMDALIAYLQDLGTSVSRRSR
ncbi:MAG: cytochrome-c oxidase, cbb3-type subunit II [Gammaproteobacteria bacterium]